MSGTQRWGQGQRIIEVLETLGSRWSAGPGSGVDQCPPLFYLGPSVLGRMNSLGLIINYSTKSSQGTEFISLWQPAVGAQCKRACGKWTMVREGPAEQGQPSGARGKMWSACLGKREWWNDHWRSWCPSAPFSRSAFCTLRSPVSLWSGSLHAVSSQNSISLREEEIYMMQDGDGAWKKGGSQEQKDLSSCWLWCTSRQGGWGSLSPCNSRFHR